MRQIYPFSEPDFKVLEEADWATAWRQDYTIQHIGRHMVIAPSWLTYQAEAEDVVITIDPGMAFGTGLHPSTRLCLMGLENTALRGRSLLDVGTGSGVLAIYAAKAGAHPVVAVDTDEVAVKVARENAERNGVADQVQLGCGSIASQGYELENGSSALWPGPFDVIAINILAEIIAQLAPVLAAHLKPEGRVVAAGIIQEREEIVRAAWAEVGLRVVQRVQEGDWVSLIGSK
jgi:ribosomal protein L11 methyltransferase